jgi:hypothetical protein
LVVTLYMSWNCSEVDPGMRLSLRPTRFSIQDGH